jgi:hypothetical protein
MLVMGDKLFDGVRTKTALIAVLLILSCSVHRECSKSPKMLRSNEGILLMGLRCEVLYCGMGALHFVHTVVIVELYH